MNSDVVRFFWERWRRAVQMDEANRISGKPTRLIFEADEWTDAYKQTLSNGQKQRFEKEWDKLNRDLDLYHNGTPKQQKNLNPMKL